MSKKTKRQTKSELVLVRMEPQLKKKLVAEAKRRAQGPSSLARTLIAQGLELEAYNRRKKGGRDA